MKIRSLALCISITPLLLAGCATQPSISQLRQATGKVVFVENGSQPLGYSTGVIDTASFWGQYGDSVGTQVGGPLSMAAGSAAARSGNIATMSKEEQNREMVKRLYGDSALVTTINAALLPKLAAAWRAPFNASTVVKLSTDKAIVVDPNTKTASGLNSDADLVLMAEVRNINLTERFSAGGALAAGFTFGTNKKSLTTEVLVVVRALKRDSASGQYKEIWSNSCGSNYALMKTSYFLEELAQDPSKMRAILDEAATQTLDYCNKMIDAAAKS